MKKNYAVIVGILVISALLALYLKPANLTLQADLKTSLDRFWGNSQTRAEVTGGQVLLSVSIPAGTRQRQKEWTFPVARWVAGRHPEARVQVWTVNDSASGQPLLEPPSLDSAQKETGAMPRPRASFQDPAFFEAARSQLLQRQGQAQLDKQLGEGRALLLVDAISGAVSWLPNLHNSADSSLNYGKRARMEGESQYGLRESDSAEQRPRQQPDLSRMEACLVIQSGTDVEAAKRVINLELNPKRGDTLRVVSL
ncbi:hypothetical protein IV102_11250 [bacterium]|nr:hypothetical protein [bacterium]